MESWPVNPARRVCRLEVGNTRFPVLCVEDFSLDPEGLVSLAGQATFIDVGSRYPGVRAPAPETYVQSALAALSPEIETHFGAAPEAELDLCAFSMVTTAPAQLRVIQRIPHFDGPESRRIALLHFLCGGRQGGTSFYRHRATGLERIDSERADEYRDRVTTEFRAEEPAPAYVSGDTRFFERIHSVDAVFNRLIVYPGNALHSGDIGRHTVFSEAPGHGRLTINGFGMLRG